MAETAKCAEAYDMGVFNSVTNEVETIQYPCEKGVGHEATSPHVFTLNGKKHLWLDPRQIAAASAK